MANVAGDIVGGLAVLGGGTVGVSETGVGAALLYVGGNFVGATATAAAWDATIKRWVMDLIFD